MPYPRKDEDKKSYISRFMESGEALKDFPDEKQRVAVAYSMWEKRNSTDPSEHPWPKMYQCNFIEPGVVFYQDLGPCKVCGNAMTCGEGKCQTEGETVLVKQEALEKMARSFIGRPVVDVAHADVTPDYVANGDADGIITEVWFDPKSGWWNAKYLVWNPETQAHCESMAYSVSCAYEPTTVAGPGQYHNLEYQEEVTDGEYTHLAVVTNPRYEGARIQIVNSKGGRMSWKFWEKGARKNAADLDPLKETVEVDGKHVPLQNLYDAAEEDEKAKAPKLNDDTVLEVKGKERTLGELKQAYRNRMKANADAESCPSCKGSGKRAAENAEKEPVVEPPLPDMRNPKENDQAEEAAKKLDSEVKEKSALELQQEKDAEAKKDEEKKNAADAEAKKDEEKKNADDNFDKAEEAAKKNAAEEKKEEKRNAGRKAFADLRNAVNERMTEPVRPSVVSIDDRLAMGRSKYGSAA